MTIRFASALLALAVPVFAQEPQPAPPAATPAPAPAAAGVENLFYKAFWLDRGERNHAAAMTLYEQFLAQAPDHALARNAADFQFALLTKTGKTKEAEAFAKKYEKLLGNVAVGAPARAGDAAPEGGERPARGAGGGERGAARSAAGASPEHLAELKKQLADAKAAGDEEKVKQLEQQIARVERAQAGGPPGDGARGQGGRRGGGMFGNVKKFAEMTKEELDTFKTQNLERMSGMPARLRENGQEERAKQVEESVTALKKALADNKLDEAQKVWDKMMASMPRRGGGGGRD